MTRCCRGVWGFWSVVILPSNLGEDYPNDSVLWSWIKWYDKTTGENELVAGFAAYDMDNEEIALHLDDGKRALTDQWFLPARRCTGRATEESALRVYALT